MKHLSWIIIITILSVQVSKAQILKGKILNQSGEPVQYSTVYIGELRQGTTSNTKGDYEIKLPAGNYTVTYQSLGYAPVDVKIAMAGKPVLKNVVLPLQYYSIPEVRITASGEDPAYIIMRKVIGMAPYYLNNVSYYKAEVYLKGNLVINRIPKLLQKTMKIEAKNEDGSSVSSNQIKAGDSYMMESFNEMEFTAPDKYFQKVISIQSTFPDEGNQVSPMEFIQASFYQPVLADMAISPLSPAAFSHYRFRYMGASLQGNFTINKIQVIPKRKSQQLFEGTIYIIEDLWCLHSVDLTNENVAGRVKIQQLYIPVENDIWLPVSHKFGFNISIMGFKADGGYGSSVKYITMRPNTNLQKPATISTDYTGKPPKEIVPTVAEISKSRKEIDKLLQKDDLSNRDMVRLSRMMEKESKKSSSDSSSKSLEVTDKTVHIIEKDAASKDSSYWATIRPIPLSDSEMRAIRVRDSVKSSLLPRKVKVDTTTTAKKKDNKKFQKASKNLMFGRSWSDTTGFSVGWNGLLQGKNFAFNTVDGFLYRLDFRLSKSWKDGGSFSVYPQAGWAFSRAKPLIRVNASYYFDETNKNQVFLRTGITSKDIGNNGGINTFINTATSLLLKKNYLKLYESRFLTVGYRSEPANGLVLELAAGYEERKVLENTADFSLSRSAKEYSPNIPGNSYLGSDSDPIHNLRNQLHGDFSAKINYTPFQKYRLSKGKKIPMGSDWPEFSLTWKHGFNEFGEMVSKLRQYDMMIIEASQRINSGAFSEFRWRFRTGGMFDNRNLPFYDFFHFNAQSFPFMLNDYGDAFMIPSFYSLSTPELFGEAHLKYASPYILLKLLPGLSNTLIRENIYLSWLGSRFHTNYTEIGYSLSEIFLVSEIGVYVGFDDLKYRSTGLKLVFKFN
jgi:hypothetical protein